MCPVALVGELDLTGAWGDTILECASGYHLGEKWGWRWRGQGRVWAELFICSVAVTAPWGVVQLPRCWSRSTECWVWDYSIPCVCSILSQQWSMYPEWNSIGSKSLECIPGMGQSAHWVVLAPVKTQFSPSVVLRPHGLQHTRPPCPLPNPGACSNSSPLSRWCHPTISSSVIPFSSRLQSFPASGSCQMSQFFTSGRQSIGVSASTSVLPMNTQDWFPLGWTGWISLQSKGLSRVFSNTTVQKHQFFGAQFSLGLYKYQWWLPSPHSDAVPLLSPTIRLPWQRQPLP